jgi:hypothetical protein
VRLSHRFYASDFTGIDRDVRDHPTGTDRTVQQAIPAQRGGAHDALCARSGRRKGATAQRNATQV